MSIIAIFHQLTSLLVLAVICAIIPAFGFFLPSIGACSHAGICPASGSAVQFVVTDRAITLVDFVLDSHSIGALQ